MQKIQLNHVSLIDTHGRHTSLSSCCTNKTVARFNSSVAVSTIVVLFCICQLAYLVVRVAQLMIAGFAAFVVLRILCTKKWLKQRG